MVIGWSARTSSAFIITRAITSVTIIERCTSLIINIMKICTCKWVSQSCIILESLRECAFHKLMIHKFSHTGAIVLHFENTRIHVRSSFKQYAVAVLSIANISLGDIDVFFIIARFDNSLNAPSMPCESSSVLAQHFSQLYQPVILPRHLNLCS